MIIINKNFLGMKYLIIGMILGLFLCNSIDAVELLSDKLVRDETNSYRDKISLSNLLPESATNIEKANPELIKTPRWYIPDLGYYSSTKMEVKQTSEEVQTSAINEFVNSTSSIFNIGQNNSSINNTVVINETSVLPYY